MDLLTLENEYLAWAALVGVPIITVLMGYFRASRDAKVTEEPLPEYAHAVMTLLDSVLRNMDRMERTLNQVDRRTARALGRIIEEDQDDG